MNHMNQFFHQEEESMQILTPPLLYICLFITDLPQSDSVADTVQANGFYNA